MINILNTERFQAGSATLFLRMTYSATSGFPRLYTVNRTPLSTAHNDIFISGYLSDTSIFTDFLKIFIYMVTKP